VKIREIWGASISALILLKAKDIKSVEESVTLGTSAAPGTSRERGEGGN
jgi:hypothetical protein